MSFPPSCRILTISSSPNQARQLAEQIISESSSESAATRSGSLETNTEVSWTISNKYYTAPVHFSVAQTKNVTVKDTVEVPACLFVFTAAEGFKDDFLSLVARLEESDFEVSIAISIQAGGSLSPTADEEDTLEGFFGEHGFEYVNGSYDQNSIQRHDVDDMERIPGIGRIIDALSTILWPSMIQKADSRRAKTRSIVSVPGPPGEEDGLRSLLNTDKDTPESLTALQREMAALEKWLEDGDDEEKDPWTGFNQTQASSGTPGVEFPLRVESGFDDNFSDFVSAPALTNTESDTEPGLPSRAEIESMSRRIFHKAVPDDVDGEGPNAPFDLSRVLSALEAMKDEIAGIPDQDEKRKAAAKVALGLVYGLED